MKKASENYVKVTAIIGGVDKEGFVSEKYLRDPVSDGREALIHQVIHEWKRFNFGLGREHEDPYFEYIGEMWRRINLDLDGKDRDVPWSAAAISYMVHNAGQTLLTTKYSKFHFAAAHSRYVHDSIKNGFLMTKTHLSGGMTCTNAALKSVILSAEDAQEVMLTLITLPSTTALRAIAIS
ncbi:MAG: DUF2272 domain-containing protein [Burkholderiales bacterium]|nr:DUF2272 domain-containing protein [Burkholderiales bacterium]